MGYLVGNITTALLACTVIFIVLGCFFINWKLNYWQRRGVKYLPPSIPFGNFQDVFMLKLSIGGLMRQLYGQTTEPFIGIYNIWRPSLLIRDPELMRAIIVKDFNSFRDRGMHSDESYDPLSGHLVMLGGDKWRNMRAKLSPTFSSGKLKSMFTALVDCGDPLDARITKAALAGDSIEMHELLAQFTTNIIASVGFGIEIDCIGNPEAPFRKIGRMIFAPSLKNSLRFLVAFLFPKLLSALKIKSVDQEVEDFMVTLVRKNMEYREQNNISRKDFFQLLLQLRNTGDVQGDGLWDTKTTTDESHKKLSITECAAHSFVFYAAGFETSSTTMSFAMYELAKNADIQCKVQQEIDEILQKHNGQITYESVTEMKYLDSVIDETLRKYPPFPMLNRECNTPWPIPNTNTVVQPGTSIIMPIYGLHNDPKYYPEPELFNPDRFSASNVKSFTERPYLPFGEGPRNCIAMRLGKMQTKVGLVLLQRKYSYQLAGASLEPLMMNKSSFILAPAGGVILKVVKRNLPIDEKN